MIASGPPWPPPGSKTALRAGQGQDSFSNGVAARDGEQETAEVFRRMLAEEIRARAREEKSPRLPGISRRR